MTELHVPVVIGPGISDKVDVAINSSSGSDAIVISTAGGDGLTRLNNDDRIWSSVGDDRHRLKTLIEYINFVGNLLILSLFLIVPTSIVCCWTEWRDCIWMSVI